MIGRFLEISIETDRILESIEFFETLGFVQLTAGETWDHPYSVLSDGRVHLGLHEYRFDSPALTFVLTDLAGKLPRLEALGIEFAFRKTDDDAFNEAGFIDPDGQMIALLEARTYSPGNLPGIDNTRLGRFTEYSMPVRDLAVSVPFWEKLGFRLAATHDDPHLRAVMAGTDLVIGLHEERRFKRPALSFAARQPAQGPGALRRAGYDLRSAIPLSGNETWSLTTPDGLALFLSGD